MQRAALLVLVELPNWLCKGLGAPEVAYGAAGVRSVLVKHSGIWAQRHLGQIPSLALHQLGDLPLSSLIK